MTNHFMQKKYKSFCRIIAPIDELHHGIGLRNVQRILSLYHSSLELEYQNGWFHAVCLVPNILIA